MAIELELRGITKRYPGVIANDAVDLTVRSGEIHAIVGENGAGKTTLMSMLYGLFPPDEGEILIRGEPVVFSSALDAIESGLGMVHQAFKLFPTLTVAENVVFRAEPTRRGLIDREAGHAQVRALADRYGLAVETTALVENLPVGVLQRVEILKALYRDARILILDEPTAVLTPQERDMLFDVIRRLREAGRTILFITHKLGEVMAVSDGVTVLRNGRSVAELVTAETTPAEITRYMVGRDVVVTPRPARRSPGESVLSVSDVTVLGEHDREVVQGATFDVRSGEVVGVAAVAGNGQSEMIEAIAGLRPVAAGTLTLAGVDVTHASVADRRAAGLAYVPEDRHGVGTAHNATVSENLLLGYQREAAISRGGWLRLDEVRRRATELVVRFAIKSPSVTNPVASLSGGNLQKLVLARELAREAPLLIAEQPTRGVDVGAIEFIHGQLLDYRDAGGALLLVSAELSEVLALSTRILVMFEGHVVAELDPAAVDEQEVGRYMTGAHLTATHA
ncbi:MAG TPA: ABC transporter ATP-binding protein [Acidimicrobiia bacterium]|nr:ABC transporter ATP-binding protein [Acidimicrobiia bacterium]